MSARPAPPPECAQCGEPIPRGASACPGCGADERTGWREASVYDGLDLSDAGDQIDTQEDAHPAARPFNGLAWYWWCLAVALLLILGLGWLGLR